ncbi:hypothetical protein [Lentzea californiensis]|uniref:hypothetical protein n=1 Tax=Lentzea californiensis TaxID=438851 RepID=UPI002165386A|nr:hypothetical protein [Lentzea californiensis]
MSRQPDRSRSRRIVLAVVLFAFIVSATGDDECGQESPLAVTGVLAAAGLLPRVIGVAGRVLVVISQPGKAIRPPCPAK